MTTPTTPPNPSIIDPIVLEWNNSFSTDHINALQRDIANISLAINMLEKDYKNRTALINQLNAISTKLSSAIKLIYDANKDLALTHNDFNIINPNIYTTCEQSKDSLLNIAEANEALVQESIAIHNPITEHIKVAITHLADLKDFKEHLNIAILYIRNVYLNTEPNRRKPVIRDLRRCFNNIANYNPKKLNFFIENQGLKHIISINLEKEHINEINNIVQQATYTANLLKKAL